MNLVNHRLQVDGFGWKHLRLSERGIVGIGIVAELTVLDILTDGPVQGKIPVTTVTVVLGDHDTSGDWRSISDAK